MNDKTREATVVGFPKRDEKKSTETPLGLLALELGALRQLIERLSYDQQQARRREVESERKIDALTRTVAELKGNPKAPAEDEPAAPVARKRTSQAHPHGRVERQPRDAKNSRPSKPSSEAQGRVAQHSAHRSSTPSQGRPSDDFGAALDELKG